MTDVLETKVLNGHNMELTRKLLFFVQVYDEQGLPLAKTQGCVTPELAYREARKIIENQVPGPIRNSP